MTSRRLEPPERIELDAVTLRADLSVRVYIDDEFRIRLIAAVNTLEYVTLALAAQRVAVKRLQRMLFGASTETTRNVCGGSAGNTAVDAPGDTPDAPAPADPEAAGAPGPANGTHASGTTNKPKAKGHGRIAARQYTGATQVVVPHALLRPGASCPECPSGKVYPVPPKLLVRLVGTAPIGATRHELERLRCNLCGKVFCATCPKGVTEQGKYDTSADAMLALLRYGTGLPLNRMASLQAGFGIPLPSSTQWERIEHLSEAVKPAFDALVQASAQAELVHNDDTVCKILELMPARPGSKRSLVAAEAVKDSPPATAGKSKNPDRTGIFTTGIVAQLRGGIRVALFFSGHQHAGENLGDVLAHRSAELAPPIHMCDALSRNMPQLIETLLAHCLSHSRRRFADVHDTFPDDCRHVIEQFEEVYKNDARARQNGLDPEQRLLWHQERSAPVMNRLKTWCKAALADKRVEPNSGLGDAIQYLLDHWPELTLFLRVAGAPLDNNICEQALKMAIIHRKNSLFYRTQHGADVGDMFMSLIFTCRYGGQVPFDYLVALGRHREQVAACPSAWLPWNYHEALALLQSPGALAAA